MPRGKQLRTKIREEILATQTTAIAVEDARLQLEKKRERNQKIPDWIRERLNKAIDRIDPIEAAAILGTTVLIKQGINWAQDVLTTPTGMDLLKFIARWGSMGLSDWYLLGMTPTPEQQAELKKMLDSPSSEVIEWLLSFTAAFFIVRYGPGQAANIVNSGKQLLGIAGAVIP